MKRLLWMCGLLAILSSAAFADQRDGRLDIYFIDVEGGAATLMVTPAGESLLIDSGYPDNGGRDRDRKLMGLGDDVGGLPVSAAIGHRKVLPPPIVADRGHRDCVIVTAGQAKARRYVILKDR